MSQIGILTDKDIYYLDGLYKSGPSFFIFFFHIRDKVYSVKKGGFYIMIAKDDIIIRKVIVHILDTVHGDCILSETLLDPGPDLYDFIRNHIYKIVTSDDTKNCTFNLETSPIYPLLESWDESDEYSFVSTSQKIAEKLYAAMGEGLDIPAADLFFVTFQAEGTIYLVFSFFCM